MTPTMTLSDNDGHPLLQAAKADIAKTIKRTRRPTLTTMTTTTDNEEVGDDGDFDSRARISATRQQLP